MRPIFTHAQKIIEDYKGEEPLHFYLKKYYKQHPILGSRDRKMINEIGYAWYRCSKTLSGAMSFEKKIKTCLFLCGTAHHHLLQTLKPEWQAKYDYFLPQKIAQLLKDKIIVQLQNLLPEDIAFSGSIHKEEWLASMLKQPDVFIRYRKNPEQLINLLSNQNISYKQIAHDCFAFPNGTKIEQWLPEKDYVIQDASSQKTGDFFQAREGESWWDCCAGAGGKSILLKDRTPGIHLTVSDTRKTILKNLEKRFDVYFSRRPEILNMDIADNANLETVLKNRQFDKIICDVPCSGSGTWARTPEQLYFFDVKQLKKFSAKQEAIAQNALKYLKKGGQMLYITCSVFKEENEAIISKMEGVTIENQQLINGVAQHADSMFVSVLKKL